MFPSLFKTFGILENSFSDYIIEMWNLRLTVKILEKYWCVEYFNRKSLVRVVSKKSSSQGEAWAAHLEAGVFVSAINLPYRLKLLNLTNSCPFQPFFGTELATWKKRCTSVSDCPNVQNLRKPLSYRNLSMNWKCCCI